MKRYIKKGDLLIFFGVAVAGVLLLFLPRLWSGGQGALAQVSVQGQVVAEIALQGEDKQFVIRQNDVSFTLERRDGAVAVTKMDCPDHICIRTGFVRTVGQMIVCLPNRVSVQIVSNDGNGEGVDVVAG